MDLLRMNALLVANRQSPHPFTMRWFTWPRWHIDGTRNRDCGTPACLLGNYAARTDLQSAFKLDRHHEVVAITATHPYTTVEIFHQAAKHFDLKQEEIEELFGAAGCGCAREDRAKALAYVEAFIARKLAEHPMPDEEEPLEDQEEVTA